jgi:hypothetical protein
MVYKPGVLPLGVKEPVIEFTNKPVDGLTENNPPGSPVKVTFLNALSF